MALASFAPTASIQMQVTQQTSSVVLPTTGSPTIALVTNQGNEPVFATLGNSSVQANIATSMVFMPGAAPFPLTIGTNTYLAAVTLSGLSALNITVGS